MPWSLLLELVVAPGSPFQSVCQGQGCFHFSLVDGLVVRNPELVRMGFYRLKHLAMRFEYIGRVGAMRPIDLGEFHNIVGDIVLTLGLFVRFAHQFEGDTPLRCSV